MTRIDFYHLQKQSLDQVLPKLIEKAYELKKNIKIKVGIEEKVEYINSLLWTFDDEKFIPHGSKKDGFSELQPIFISSENNNPNNSVLLFVIDDADIDIEKISDFERIFYIFDGNSEFSLNKARILYKALKNSGNSINYWQQNQYGKWEQKA